MLEAIKKSILAGLGTAVVTKTRVKETIQTLVDQGKLTTEEADRVFREMTESGQKEYDEIQSRINQSVNKVLARMNLATKEETEALKSRLDNLEKRLDILQNKFPQQNA